MCKKRIVLLIAALAVIFCGCVLFGCAEKDDGEHSAYTGTSHTVTFYYNYDGAPNDGVYKTETVSNDESVSKPADPTREGFEFDGWHIGAIGAAKVDVTAISVTSDLSFYAGWKIKQTSSDEPTLEGITITALPTKLTYVVGESFSADGMIVTASYAVYTQSGETIASSEYSRALTSAEYTVTGADTSTRGVKTVSVAFLGKTETFTITVLGRYTVQYNGNCGSYPVNTPSAPTVTEGDKLTEPSALALKGFTFGGWYKTAACAGGEAWSFAADTVTSNTTLYAKWTAKSYNIVYELDGGVNGANPTSYTATNNVFGTITLADAGKEHYDFCGWYKSSSFAAADRVTAIDYDLIPSIENTITLYAKFTPKTYTITYEFGGNAATYAAAFKQNAVVPQSYVFGSSVTLPDASAIAVENKGDDEYNFLGWCAQPIAGDDPQYVTSLPATAYGNKTFYAHIAAVPVYTVTFDKNYTGATPVTVNVAQGSTVAAIDEPTRVGYEFIGWYNGGSQWSFTTLIDEDTVLTASWNKITYNIQYKWGSNAVAVDDAFKTYDVDCADITLPRPSKQHYTFDGWFVSSSLTGNAVTTIDKSFVQGLTIAPVGGAVGVTLYAKYTPDKYSVTFNENKPTTSGAVTGMPTAGNIDYGELIAEPSDPSLNGYTFGGWYKVAACADADAWDFDNDTVGGVTVLYAKWNIITRNVTYMLDNGTNAQGNPVTVDVNSGTVTLGNAVKAYYTFGGWYSNSSFAESSKVTSLSFATLDGDITLYAKFTAIQYTVAYSTDGGNNPTSNPTAYVASDGEITLADATKDYYAFDGWYTDSAMSQNKKVTKITSADFNTSSASTLTLYAKFVKTEYTVNYILPAVPSDAVNTQNNVSHRIYRFGDADYTLENAITATVGYRFVEWRNSDGERVTKIERVMFDPTGDVTSVSLTAVFSNMYTVRFDATDGSFAADAETEVSLAYGSKVTAPTTKPTLDGHTLVGWYKDNGYANAWNFAQDTVSADITLYAKWMENPENGVYLLGTFNGWSMFDEDIADYKFQEHATGETKYSIGGVQFAVGDEFKVIKYKDGDVDYDVLNTYKNVYRQSNNVITLTHTDNFKVTALSAVAKESFTIYVGENASGQYISFVLDARNPSYESEKVNAKATPTADVYLRGTFSKEFGVCDAWSSDSEIIDVKVIDNVYYFQNVYLTTYDEFKVYLKADDKWYGNTFTSLGTPMTLSSNNAPDIAPSLESGYYNIVFENGTTKKLTVYAHADITASVKSDPIYVGQTPTLANIEYSGATLTAANISADAATVGTNAIRIIYNGSVIDLTYTATAVALTDIEIKAYPNKTEYVVTEDFDETGLIITAVYNNGDRVDKTSGFTITTPEWTVGSNKKVTVAFTDGVRKTTTFDITIIARAITSVEYTGTLAKTSYTVGEAFDATGLVFTVMYNDGEVIHPPAAQMTFTANGMNASNVFTANGTPQIEVSYSGAKATQKISVSVGVAIVTITYYDYDGATSIAVVYEKDSAVAITGDNAKRTPTSREGYTFEGWYKDDTLATAFTDSAWSASIPLYGKWSEIQYTVTYNPVGGQNNANNPTTYKISDGNVALANPTPPTGKDFEGWYTALTGGDKVEHIDIALFDGETSKTLFARYTDKEYTVTFNGNKPTGASATVTGLPVDQKVVHGGKVEEPQTEPTLPGYEFGGWYTTAACAEADAWDFESDTVTSITTLYAKWTAIVREDGIYSDGVFVKAFSDNGSTDTVTKLKVENVNLAKNAVITFVYNHEDLVANLRTGTGMSARISKVDGNITVSGLAAGKTHGVFSFYYASSGNEAGFWINDCEDYVAPDLKTGDGLYNGSTPVKEFELNEDGVNEVKAEEFKLTAATTLTVKYGGENKSVTIKDGCTLGSVSDGKIVLQAGTYSVYYSYSKNAVWINGTPDTPVSNKMTVNFSVAGFDTPIINVKIHAWGSSDYTEYGKTSMTGTDGYNFSYTFTRDAAKGNIKGIIIMFTQSGKSWTAKSTNYETNLGAGETLNLKFDDWNNTIYGQINWNTWSDIPFDMKAA